MARRLTSSWKVLIGVTLAVVACDLVTKELALALLSKTSAGAAPSLGIFQFHLAMNEGAAGGISLGEYTRALNITSMLVVATLAAAISSSLAPINRLSPIALGLIAGGALGNTASLVVRSGVVDFIAFGTVGGALTVINLADVAAFAGIGLMFPVTASLVARIRSERTETTRVSVPTIRAPRRVVFEREVPIAVVVADAAVQPETTRKVDIEHRRVPTQLIADRATGRQHEELVD